MGLVEGLTGSEAMGVSLGTGTTVTTAVATGAMVVIRVGAAVTAGFTLVRQVQPPSSAATVSTVPRKIRILFRFKGHTSFFQVMPLVLPRGNENIHTRFCQFFGFYQNQFHPPVMSRQLHPLGFQSILAKERKKIDQAVRPIAKAKPPAIVQQGEGCREEVPQPIPMPLPGPLGILPRGGLGIVRRVHGDQVVLPEPQSLGRLAHVLLAEVDVLAIPLGGEMGQAKLSFVRVDTREGAAIDSVCIQRDDPVARAQVHGSLLFFCAEKMDEAHRILGEAAQRFVLIDAIPLELQAFPTHDDQYCPMTPKVTPV